MSTLIREKQPSYPAVNNLVFHPHEFVRIEGEISRILVGTAVDRLGSGQIMPLFAGDLASSAGRAQRRIDKK
jgi:hypothetical protein